MRYPFVKNDYPERQTDIALIVVSNLLPGVSACRAASGAVRGAFEDCFAVRVACTGPGYESEHWPPQKLAFLRHDSMTSRRG